MARAGRSPSRPQALSADAQCPPPLLGAWHINSLRGAGTWVPNLPTARPKGMRVSLCFCDGHSPGHRVGGEEARFSSARASRLPGP